MHTVTHIGDRVFSARKARKLLQSQLAAKAGVSQSMVACIETHRNGVSIATARVLADALCVGLTWLLTGDGPDPGFPMLQSKSVVGPVAGKSGGLSPGRHQDGPPSAQAG